MKKFNRLICLPLLFLWISSNSQSTEHSVFNAHRGSNNIWLTYAGNHRALYNVIALEAFRMLDEREEKVARLTTAEAWTRYKSEVKEALCRPLDEFRKSPLNATTTGTLERENFLVEKVLFESHPGFFVTAALFIPKERQQPAPTVIYCAGHTEQGFRSETYQHVILNLVEKGYIVLAFDPAGQGERLQYVDPRTGKSKIGGPTTEHSYAGVQTLLTGTSLSGYFIWDGIRALDYLETRPEVDMSRIGITGRSGGGTQAAMIAACDNRILAAAPENYITSFRRLLQSIGPQDAEQNPWQAIANGIDHADFLHLHAPKPMLLLTTTHDFFSIQGARETFAEAGRAYQALGFPDHLQMVEDLGGHQSTRNNREALYAFFGKHLKQPGDTADEDVTPFSYQELLVTPTGQVNTSFSAETISSLNRKYYSEKNISGSNQLSRISHAAGISFARNLKVAVFTGIFTENDVTAEKFFLEQDTKDYALPVYILRSKNSGINKSLVWIHPGGKETLLNDPLLTEVLKSGFVVITADLPGTGELKDPEFTGDGVIEGIPFNYTFGANLVGKSIAGIQVEAIDLLMQFINKHEPLKKSVTYALSSGNAAVPLFHYGCLKNTFEKVAVYNLPASALSLVEMEIYNPEAAWTAVPGGIPANDIPSLLKKLSESGTEVFTEQAAGSPQKGSSGTASRLLEFLME